MKIEQRTFKPDENVIFHLIKSQNSTPLSAIKELIQNSFDAGATKCDIKIDNSHFEIIDNGAGFLNKDDILENFEKFGKPHEEDYKNKFGRFRMGRCQIMAFAKTHWESNNFQFSVDIKEMGLNYNLSETSNLVDGCSIKGTWYEPNFFTVNSFLSLDDFIKNLSFQVKYIQNIEININNQRANVDINKENISYEDEDMYLIKSENSGECKIFIFNLGMFVDKKWHRTLSASIITKKHLTLDISRQCIAYECPIYENIEQTIRTLYPNKRSKSIKLSNYDRYNIYLEVFKYEFEPDWSNPIRDKKLFIDVSGAATYSMEELRKSKFILASKNTNKVDKINQSGIITIDISLLQNAFLECNDLRCSPDEVFEEFLNLTNEVYKKDILSNKLNYNEAIQKINDDTFILPLSSLTKEDIALVNAITTAHLAITNDLLRYKKLISKDIRNVRGRKILVGNKSTTSLAWTDGKTYIAISQKHLLELKKGDIGISNVVKTLLHEYCHFTPENLHDGEFYRDFHILTCNLSYIPYKYQQLIKLNIIKNFNKENLKIPVVLSDEQKLKNVQAKNAALSAEKELLEDKVKSCIWKLFDSENITALELIKKYFPSEVEEIQTRLQRVKVMESL